MTGGAASPFRSVLEMSVMEYKGFDKSVAIDQEEALRPKMVTVEIAGKKYEVPEGITEIGRAHV